VRLEALGQLKIPMTSSGIESATFWLVYLSSFSNYFSHLFKKVGAQGKEDKRIKLYVNNKQNKRGMQVSTNRILKCNQVHWMKAFQPCS
jgi:hypothetical protein